MTEVLLPFVDLYKRGDFLEMCRLTTKDKKNNIIYRPMNFRDLEAVRQLVLDATGLEITYSYDDLVFPDSTVFIIQFDDENLNNLFCHFQEDFLPEARQNVLLALQKEGAKRECTVEMKGTFELKENGDNMDIAFYPLA